MTGLAAEGVKARDEQLFHKIPCSCKISHICATRLSHEQARPASMRDFVRSGAVSVSDASQAAINSSWLSAISISGAYCRIWSAAWSRRWGGPSPDIHRISRADVLAEVALGEQVEAGVKMRQILGSCSFGLRPRK